MFRKRPMLKALIFCQISMLFAQDTKQPFLPYLTAVPPIIDGKLDDEVWGKAPSESNFKTWYPDYNKDMKEKTVVHYAYDKENLYFAFKAYDTEPTKIKSSISARDNTKSDDWICINLDTFNDQQSLYSFYVNPLGIQSDSRSAGGKEDENADFVWYSVGLINEEGYTVEVKIPLKSIRFSNTNPVEMGVIFERHVSRQAELGTYPPLDPKQGANFFTQTRPLLYENINYSRLFEILPAVTYGNLKTLDKGKLSSSDNQGDLSITTKIGITSNMIFDGTLNPDFSQVEADAGQVDFNQRFALFFPEKRSFFLEGRETFNYAGNILANPLVSVVHTRNIANPTVGLKLTGKASNNVTISSIYAIDELPDDSPEGGEAQFGIFRAKKALSNDSYVGTYYTGREIDSGFNRVVGSDGLFRINPSSTIGYLGLMSANNEFDSKKTNNGHFLSADYLYGTRDLSIIGQVFDITEDFETKTGFRRRRGISRVVGIIKPKFYPKTEKIRRVDISGLFAYMKDNIFNDNEIYESCIIRLILPGNFKYMIRYNIAEEIFQGIKFDKNAFETSLSSQLTKKFYFRTSYKNSKRIWYASQPYQGHGNDLSASITYQPTGNIFSSLDLTYTDFFREDNSKKEFDYIIARSRITYQLNRYLFVRGVVEFDSFEDDLTTDLLGSFTYIPGTVMHFGYGSLYQKNKWQDNQYVQSDHYIETKRGLFFKASYLWRF